MRPFALLTAERNSFVTDRPTDHSSFAQRSTIGHNHQQIRRTVPLQTAARFGARSGTSTKTAKWAVQIFELLTLYNVKLSVQRYSDTDTVFIIILNSPIAYLCTLRAVHAHRPLSARAVFMYFAQLLCAFVGKPH
jgi:hypothetical protein